MSDNELAFVAAALSNLESGSNARYSKTAPSLQGAVPEKPVITVDEAAKAGWCVEVQPQGKDPRAQRFCTCKFSREDGKASASMVNGAPAGLVWASGLMIV
jgi:hypothetical protein